jgi:hypothetical protein
MQYCEIIEQGGTHARIAADLAITGRKQTEETTNVRLATLMSRMIDLIHDLFAS